jgi:hypothetical protein
MGFRLTSWESQLGSPSFSSPMESPMLARPKPFLEIYSPIMRQSGELFWEPCPASLIESSSCLARMPTSAHYYDLYLSYFEIYNKQMYNLVPNINSGSSHLHCVCQMQILCLDHPMPPMLYQSHLTTTPLCYPWAATLQTKSLVLIQTEIFYYLDYWLGL